MTERPGAMLKAEVYVRRVTLGAIDPVRDDFIFAVKGQQMVKRFHRSVSEHRPRS